MLAILPNTKYFYNIVLAIIVKYTNICVLFWTIFHSSFKFQSLLEKSAENMLWVNNKHR